MEYLVTVTITSAEGRKEEYFAFETREGDYGAMIMDTVWKWAVGLQSRIRREKL